MANKEKRSLQAKIAVFLFVMLLMASLPQWYLYLDEYVLPLKTSWVGAPAVAAAPRISIPKILHFVYVSPGLPNIQDPLPDDVQTRISKWQNLHPNTWNVVLWNNSLVREHFPHIVKLCKNVVQMAWVADLVRYHAVQKFGGVYLDQDFDPYRPLDPLVGLNAFAVCVDPHPKYIHRPTNASNSHVVMNRTSCTRTCNGVFGFPKNHSCLKEVIAISMNNTIKAVRNNPRPRFHHTMTGPVVFSSVVKKDPSVEILYPHSFLPCRFSHQNECIRSHFENDTNIFAMHLWDNSWSKT